MTPAEYIQLEEQTGERYEYWNGEVFAMSGGTLPHNLIAAKLNRKIGSLIEGKGCEVVGSDQKVVVLATGLETYPDLTVYCGQPHLAGANSLALANPVLLAEVLSPSTEAYDRGDKAAHYRRIPSLQEYLLIAQDRVRVERYRRVGNNDWLLSEFTALTDVIELNSLAILLPVAALYADVPLEPGPRR
jgi:Uma2 family endonuclease